MATVGRLNVVLGAKVRGFLAGMRAAKSGMQDVQASMQGIATGAAKMGAAFTLAGGTVAVVTAGFEKQMTRAASIAGSSVSQISDALGGITEGNAAQGVAMLEKSFQTAYDGMTKSALEMAAKTEFTARQVGEGMTFMAMAGSDATQTIAAMPTVLQLASAAAVDLGMAADTVTNVMAGFGITTQKIGDGLKKATGKIPTATQVIGKMKDELSDTNNVLVATFTGANTTLGELGESFKNAGPVAKSLGVSIEELSATMGVLGNAGIKGSEAGTGMKRAIIAIAGASGKSAKALGRFGIKASDVAKKGLTPIIAQLQKAKKSFTDAHKETEFTGLLFEAFGDRAGPKMAALVEQGAESIRKLTDRIAAAKGLDLAAFLEAKQLATFTGQFNILKSNVEAVVISIGQQLLPILKPLVKTLADIIKKMNTVSPGVKKAVAVFILLGIAVSGVVFVLATVAAMVAGAVVAFSAFSAVWPIIAPIAVGLIKVIAILIALAAIVGFVASFWEDELNAMGDSSKKAAVDFEQPWTDFFKGFIAGFLQVSQFFKNVLGVIVMVATMAVGIVAVGFAVLWDGIIFGMNSVERAWDMMTVSLLKGARDLLNKFPSLEKVMGFDASIVGDEISKLEKKIAATPLKLNFDAASATEAGLKGLVKGEYDTLISDLSGVELYDGAMAGIENAFDRSGRGLGAIMTAALGDGGEGILKSVEAVLGKAKGAVADLGRGVDTVGGGGKESKASKARRKANEDLLAIIKAEGRLRTQTTSSFSALEGIVDTFKDKMENVTKLWVESNDDILAGQAASAVIKTQSALVVANLNGIKNSEELTSALGFVKENADRLAISFEKVKEQVNALGFDDITADAGPSLSKLLSEGLFNSIPSGRGGASPEIAKGATDIIGGELAGIFTGQGGSIGSMVGGAIGAVAGSPQVGAMIGQAIETVILGIGDMFGGVVETVGNALISLIPESRLQNSAGGAVAAIAGMTAAIVHASIVTALVTSTLLGLLATLSVVTVITAALTGGFSLLVQALAAVIVVFAVVLVGAILYFAAALIVGVLAPLLMLGAAVGGAIGMFLFIASLASQSNAAKKFQDALTSAVDMLLVLFDPLSAVLMPLAGLLLSSLGLLKPFIDSFVQGLVRSKQSIFDFAKGAAVGIGSFLVAVAHAQNAILDLAVTLSPAFLFVVDIMIFFGKAVSGVAEGLFHVVERLADMFGMNELKAGAVAGRASLHALTNTMPDEMRSALVGIISQLGNFKVDPGAVQAAVDAIAGLTLEQADLAGEALAALKESNEGMNQALLNAPQGFKDANDRFNSIVGGLGNADVPGEGAFEGKSMAFDIENMFVVAADPEQFSQQMEREAARKAQQQTGSTGGRQFPSGGNF